MLVIDENKTSEMLDLSCEVEGQTAYTTRLIIEGSGRCVNVCYDNTVKQLKLVS